MNKKIILFIYYVIFLYILISFFEWIIHYYAMHYNGGLKNILNYYNINIENSHIDHHKETRLDQTLPDNYIEEGIVFNLLDADIFYISIFVLGGSYIFWLYFPKFKKSFSLISALLFSFVLLIIYFWVWNSIHTNYHGRYIECNKKLKNNPNIIIYSLFPNFSPNENSPVYKYLFWYHALHHLNKGVDKGNYNIIFPLFDHVFGFYKYNVNNTKYFSSNKPNTPREKWLKEHLIFDIRITNNNKIEYKDINSNYWKLLPKI